MKSFKKYILLLIATSVAMFGCEDYLMVPPEAEISKEDVFGTYVTYQGFIDPMYQLLVEYNSHSICCGQNLGGETYSTTSWNTAYMAVNGLYKGLSYNNRSNFQSFNKNDGGIRPNSWKGIRRANIAISSIDLLLEATDQEKDFLLGQAYFFRAFFHWDFARAYGSIPYFDEVLGDNVDFPRYWEDAETGKKNWQALAERVCKDLDEAAKYLPETWPNQAANLGRITKGAALALKAKTLLYAGSPLMNEDAGNSATFDKEYMERAAAAAVEILKMADNGIYSLTPFENYTDNFYRNDGSYALTKETIFWKHSKENGSGLFNIKIGRLYLGKSNVLSGPGGNNVVESPTQNFVDMFEMADGTLYKTEYDNNNDRRWGDRDPRFRHNIYVDRDVYGKSDESLVLELYNNEPGMGMKSYQSLQTPYHVKKYWPKGANNKETDYNQFRLTTPYIRLAEIYLIYAEAVYEAYNDGNASAPGYSLTAYEAVNKVRNRAGMPSVSAGNLQYSSFRELVRNERAVELCFEGHYWYDIRRWKTAENLYPDGLQTIVFDKDWTSFSREHLVDFIFEPRHYWLPFIESETQLFVGFPQNPGW